MAKLTPKQERFVAEYLVDLNATAAARRAGYSDPSYGRQVITKPHVAAAIDAAKAARARRVEITADRVLQELGNIAFADMRELCRWDGERVTLVPSAELTEEQAAAIRTVRARRTTKRGGTVVEVQSHDKVSALKVLADHVGVGTRRLWDEAEVIATRVGVDPHQLIAEARSIAKIGGRR